MKKGWIAAIVFLSSSVPAALSYSYCDIPLAYYCKELSQSILNVAEIVTTAGESKWYYFLLVPAYVVLRIILKNKLWSMRILFLFTTISASGLISTLIKWLAGRHRPINLFNNGLFGFDYFRVVHESTSFPSGHTVTVFSLAAAVCILFPRWSIPAFIAAVAIGLSRILITAHYLSDVLVGAGIGILSTLAVKYFFDKKHVELAHHARVGSNEG